MKLLLSVIFLLICSAAFSQFEFSTGVSYEVPLGELGDVFKNSQGYQLSILRGKKYKTDRESWGVKLGYLNFEPKQDTVLFEIYSVDGIEYGKISFDNYIVFQLMVSWRHDKVIGRKIEFFYGTDFGMHHTSFSYQETSTYSNDGGRESITRIAISPRTGISLVLNKHIVLGFNGSYSISAGAAEDPKRIINQFVSCGVSVIARL